MPQSDESAKPASDLKPKSKVAIFLNNGIKIVGAVPNEYTELQALWDAAVAAPESWLKILTLPFERQTQAELMYFKVKEIVLFCVTEVEPEGRIIRATPDLPEDVKRDLRIH